MPPEPLVLAFDTSAAHCAAALLSGTGVLDHRVEDMATGQAERLMPLLNDMLHRAGLGWRDLAALGVGTGPGNFTGVRIAVSAARGLALGLGIPAVGVTALQAQAHGTTGPVLSALDARRGSLYLQGFGGADVSAQICTPDDLPPLPQGATCIGFMADDLAARCQGQTALPAFPLAVATALVAGQQRLTHPARPAPFYLRAADAAPSSDLPPVILP